MNAEASSSPSAALTVAALHAPFGAAVGLVDVSFRIEPHERLAVIGPSGAGKTTLLRAIAGLAAVSAGRIHVADRDVTDMAAERRSVVYLHQQPVLFEHLNVADNVGFALQLRRTPDSLLNAQVAEALDVVQLGGFQRRLPRTLSGGQRHRVALARAIAARPDVLLLDEPLAALDPSLRDDVRRAIINAHAGSTAAMVVATHDLDDAGALADVVAVLIGGTIAQFAQPAALFARPASLAVARLLGAYQELPGVVRHDGAVVCALGVLPNAAGAAPHTPVVVAFRRADLRATAERVHDSPIGARITGLRARAEETTLELRLDGQTDGPALEARNDPHCVLHVGDACVVTLDPRGALVFRA